MICFLAPITLKQHSQITLLRTEWRRGGRSPEVKKRSGRSSCSPLKKRRRSQSPGGWVKEPNAHEVLKGILKSEYTKDHSSRSRIKIPQEVRISKEEAKISCKSKTVEKGAKSFSRRSQSPSQRWGQERVRQLPARSNLDGGSSKWRKQSPRPYAGSRKSCLEKRSPDRCLKLIGCE